MNSIKVLTNGLVKENPTFVLLLGMCPTLATTTSLVNGLSMGLSTTVADKETHARCRANTSVRGGHSFVRDGAPDVSRRLFPVSQRLVGTVYTADCRQLYHPRQGRGFRM